LTFNISLESSRSINFKSGFTFSIWNCEVVKGKSIVRWFTFDILKFSHLTLATIFCNWVKAHYKATLGKKMYSFLGIFCFILGETFLWFHLAFWYKGFQHNYCHFSYENKFSTKCFLSTHLCSFEWKTCLDVFCEITWVKLFNYNWNATINSYSIYD
jgi:hypothetical protein